jgi:uncharacterized protein
MPPRGLPELEGLILQVTHDCNLRCRYCSAEFGRYGRYAGRMSPEVARTAVDFLLRESRAADLALTYFGGEPLLNLGTVLSSARYARKRARSAGRRMSLHLVTNGVALTGRALEALDALDFSLTVSLDGPRGAHDLGRPFPDGSGSHRLTESALRLAAERPIGQRVTVRGSFARPSAWFFPNVVYLVEKGFSRNIAFEPIFLPPRHPMALRWKDLPAIRRAYRDLAEYYARRFERGKPFCLWDFDDAITQVALGAPRRSRCGAGVKILAVTGNGDLYACHMSTGMEQARLGTLSRGISAAARRPWANKYLRGRPGCRSCRWRPLCGGGCNTHALMRCGSLATPDRWECELIRLRYRLAGRILKRIPGLASAIRSRLAPSLHKSGGQAGAAGRDAGHQLTPLWTLSR